MHTTSNISKKPHIDLSKVSNKWIKKILVETYGEMNVKIEINKKFG